MSVPDCPECQRLWREYYDAAFNLVACERKLKLAATEGDETVLSSAHEALSSALRQRRLAQLAFKAHEQTAHPASGPGRSTRK